MLKRATGGKRGKMLTGVEHGKTCSLVPSVEELVSCNRCQARKKRAADTKCRKTRLRDPCSVEPVVVLVAVRRLDGLFWNKNCLYHCNKLFHAIVKNYFIPVCKALLVSSQNERELVHINEHTHFHFQ